MNERYAQRAVTRYESTSQAQQWPRPARPKPDDEGTEMRTFVKASIALTAMLASTLLAVSDDVPVLNIVPVCRGIALQAANPTEKGGPDLDLKNCTSSEQEVRVQLAKVWSTFQPADKGHCIRLAQTGGESSYTELITCLEMAQGVRNLRSTSYTKGIN